MHRCSWLPPVEKTKKKKRQTQKKKKKTTLFTELVGNCWQRQKRAMFVNFKEKLFMVQQDFSTGFVLCPCRMALVLSWGSWSGELGMLVYYYYCYTIAKKKLWCHNCIGIASNSIRDVSCCGAQRQSGQPETGVMWEAVLAALLPSCQSYSVHTMICK